MTRVCFGEREMGRVSWVIGRWDVDGVLGEREWDRWYVGERECDR